MDLKKRLTFGSLMRKGSSQDVTVDLSADTPEANAARGVRLFCESSAANAGEEVLHLPTIVESAVASPAAAAAAAQQIRAFLSKENYARPHVQYHGVMLIRILADNPGPSFTKNLDKRFADTIKHLLRNGRDPSVAQILSESLDALEREKAHDTNLNLIFAMWRREKSLMVNAAKQFGPRTPYAPAWSGQQQAQVGFRPGARPSARTLPAPGELAGRVEEARTSAKLLLQLVQSTPADELLTHDLVKEFAERCTAAQRSLQGYIACDDPPPDDDTMLTLIETNEQLSLAASKHQRAVLQARRLVGGSSPPAQQNNNLPQGVPTSTYDSSVPQRDFAAPALLPIRGISDQPGRSPNSPPTTLGGDDASLPASLQADPRHVRTQDNDPFADPKTTAYTPPSGAPQDGQTNGTHEPYDPGYRPTPSYLNRQESSGNVTTTHGAHQPRIEEQEYARDNPSGQGPRTTPRANPNRQQGADLSPIAERSAVTYRY